MEPQADSAEARDIPGQLNVEANKLSRQKSDPDRMAASPKGV